jgi:23S rRNA (adenine2030-N6)-methyltransferase
MNYRHGYHAGNFADVLKHAILLACLEYLRQKPKPAAIVDTHAGAGQYDLTGEEAQKTGEWRDGIGRLLDASQIPPIIQRYVSAITAVQPEGGQGLTRYPGSPLLILQAMRPQDRLVAIELHPPTAEALAATLKGRPNARIQATNGYAALSRLIPPPERRGLVLIDPPFEAEDEFERLARLLTRTYERWPGGMFIAWYPAKDPRAVERFEAELANAAIPDLLVAGLTVKAPSERLAACNLMVINPPWTLHAALAEALPWLARTLAQGDGADHRLQWLGPPR